MVSQSSFLNVHHGVIPVFVCKQQIRMRLILWTITTGEYQRGLYDWLQLYCNIKKNPHTNVFKLGFKICQRQIDN